MTMEDRYAPVSNALRYAGWLQDLVRFGIETATDRIKKSILKRVFSDRVTRDAFSVCHEINLRTFSYVILANPTETREEMLATLRLMADLLTDGLKVSLGYPYPGTEYHDIAKELDLIDEDYPNFHNFIRESKLKWSDEDRVWIDKVRAVCRSMYGAGDVAFTKEAAKDLRRVEELGLGGLPVCIAKAPSSLSDDPALRGRPRDFQVTVRNIQVNSGAGFLVVLTGDIMRMPGLPKRPLAERMRFLPDGKIEGIG